LNLDVSNDTIFSHPLNPEKREFWYSFTFLPIGVIAPKPVITTLLEPIFREKPILRYLLGMLQHHLQFEFFQLLRQG